MGSYSEVASFPAYLRMILEPPTKCGQYSTATSSSKDDVTHQDVRPGSLSHRTPCLKFRVSRGCEQGSTPRAPCTMIQQLSRELCFATSLPCSALMVVSRP